MIDQVKELVSIMRENDIAELVCGQISIKLHPPRAPSFAINEDDLKAVLRNPLDTPVNEEAALFWSADGGAVLDGNGKPVDVPLMGGQ